MRTDRRAAEVGRVRLAALAVALALLAILPLRAAHADIAADTEALLTRFAFPPEQVGYLLVDLETGEQVAGGRVDQGFIPASTAKVPAMVAALGILGPDYRPRTEVLGDGLIVDGMFHGDIYLRGLGDPLLTTDGLKDLAAQLAGAGIRGITGSFRFDPAWLPQTRLITPTQPVTAGYNPGVAALSVNFNRVHLEWTPSGPGIATAVYAYADSGRVTVDWIDVENGGSFGALLDYGSDDGGQESWVHADSLHGEGAVWLPVRQPAYHAAMLFRAVAANAGIVLPEPIEQPTPASAYLLAVHEGETLPVLVSQIFEHSNNLAAELVGLAAARQQAGPLASLTHGVNTTAAWLQRQVTADWAGYAMENHSGLSSQSRISPAQMCAILGYADSPDGPHIFDLLSPVRWEGNLNQGQSGSRVQVRAKTGTMAYAVGLAGYIVAQSGRRLAFAIFVSDFAAREALDAVLDLRDASTPASARNWFNRARELERTMVTKWAENL
ncbi:MAG: D-alanyl-D-alanine carboxypeptidase/D-alanyl-D-alanine-endopeptidase [Alphaproteobacteria bacterium]